MSKNRKSSAAGAEFKKTAAAFIIDKFNAAPDKSFSTKNIISTVGAATPQQRDQIREIIKKLFDEGFIELAAEGKYRLSNTSRQSYDGYAEMTSYGSLFVVVEGLPKDVHVESNRAAHALYGDKVRVVIVKKAKNDTINPEGEVIEVLERSKKIYVGVVEMSESYAFVRVDNRKMPYDIFVPIRDLKGAENGQKVTVVVTDWPNTMKNPQGVVTDVLGNPGDNNTEMHAILAEFGLPYSYPKDVEQEAYKIADGVTAAEVAKRKDFRGVPTMTIDPDTAKDFDDALSLRVLPNGNYEVGVHIADVTHYVRPNTNIETEGQNRATSIYLVDRTIPMLPEKLSNELCSLRPNEDKLAFSAIFELTPEAKLVDEWFGRTVINSDRRFTYNEAQQIIEGAEGDMKSEVLSLNALAVQLRRDRFRDGSIAFERDEAKFVLDENGKPLSVFFSQMKESNQLIEEFMLMANRRVAEFIGRKREGHSAERTFVYRIHDKPNEEKLMRLSSFVSKFGYKFEVVEGRAVAKDINKLMKEIHGKQEENIISTLAIRSMAKAVYTTENIGHYGLAFKYYTHFTSPIRRYPDMMVHRLLAHYLEGGKSENREEIEKLCQHSSAMEVRAAEAERASIKYKMVEFMIDKLGQEFDGHISGITEWGIYVEIAENKIEGMVSMRDMNDDFYDFDAQTYSITGRSKHRRFTLGDQVRIRVARADLAHKQLDFEMVASYDFGTNKERLIGQ